MDVEVGYAMYIMMAPEIIQCKFILVYLYSLNPPICRQSKILPLLRFFFSAPSNIKNKLTKAQLADKLPSTVNRISKGGVSSLRTRGEGQLFRKYLYFELYPISNLYNIISVKYGPSHIFAPYITSQRFFTRCFVYLDFGAFWEKICIR